MYIEINDKKHEIIIEKKDNKNMYLRIKKDLNIYIYAPKKISEKEIREFIEKNYSAIQKNLNEISATQKSLKDKIIYLGNKYEIIYIDNKDLILGKDKIFINKNFNLEKWYKKQAELIFKERFEYCYQLFEEKIPKPEVKLRKMTSKWGVCNYTRKIITLNTELIKLDIKYIDYVIIHELSHLIYPNHSKKFWDLVNKYEKNYKKYKKEMKNII